MELDNDARLEKRALSQFLYFAEVMPHLALAKQPNRQHWMNVERPPV